MQATNVAADQVRQLALALKQRQRRQLAAVELQEIEGEHRKLMLSIGCYGRLQTAEVRTAVGGGEDELAIDDRSLALDVGQRLHQDGQAFGPLVAACRAVPCVRP